MIERRLKCKTTGGWTLDGLVGGTLDRLVELCCVDEAHNINPDRGVHR